MTPTEYEALLPNRMFRNDRGVRFQDVTTSGGFGQLQKGHAVSFADFNRDGSQDVFEVIGGAYPGDTYMSSLLLNPGHANHWLGLKLEGVKSNRSAIGARVRVDFDEPSGPRSIYRVVNSGTSFGDAPLELHLGLVRRAPSARSRFAGPRAYSRPSPAGGSTVFTNCGKAKRLSCRCRSKASLSPPPPQPCTVTPYHNCSRGSESARVFSTAYRAATAREPFQHSMVTNLG